MTNNQRYVKLFLCTYLDHSYVRVKNENLLVGVISNFINITAYKFCLEGFV